MSLRVFLAQGDEVVERSVGSPLAAITRYLALRMPEILSHSIPFAVLLATLITLSGMQRQNELTAMKSFGMSQLRMMLALAPVAILIALPQFWIDSTFVPSSVAKLRAWGVGDYKPVAARDETGLTWARQGHDVGRFGAATEGGLANVTGFSRAAASRLREHTAAGRAGPCGAGWLLEAECRGA